MTCNLQPKIELEKLERNLSKYLQIYKSGQQFEIKGLYELCHPISPMPLPSLFVRHIYLSLEREKLNQNMLLSDATTTTTTLIKYDHKYTWYYLSKTEERKAND